MGSMWKKAKVALATNMCVFVPKVGDEEENSRSETSKALDASDSSDATIAHFSASSAAADGNSCSERRLLRTMTPTPSSSGLRLSKSESRSCKKTCAICLGSIKTGHGALFTAECSHTFHFNCIASNVKHGNLVCPICRAKWKEVPLVGPPSSGLPYGRARVNPVNWHQEDGTVMLLRRLPRAVSSSRQHQLASLSNISEPTFYDDDEPTGFLAQEAKGSNYRSTSIVDIKAYPEFYVLPKMASEEAFSILIHLTAPCAFARSNSCSNQNASLTALQPCRAPADLVTVLDISGSMAGTKLALLKRAMGFVIQNLGPSDRLSVIAFSSTARRLFPLRRMTESGRQHALQAVNSLVSNGGTNIAEGLRKGAKVIDDRRWKNPVCSIILLSDGQDTYTASSSGGGVNRTLPDYQSLVPSSIRSNNGNKLPVHAFGFGADHDSFSMHSISEDSGGTFSFIESESAIQDAFAQCIGGLLSVVVQELIAEIECVRPGVRISSMRSGSYPSQLLDGLKGSICVGDLYADEERDFLVSVNVPPVADEETVLLRVGCSYKDPLSKETVNLSGQDLRIQRPDSVAEMAMSVEVDREKNRIFAAEDMAKARAAAERGALSEAVLILEARRAILSQSLLGRSGDQLCASLDAELREMQHRMESWQRYEESGRAYVLSGLSSHSWQRATARGDSTERTSLVHSYQTPSMVDMLQRSQTLSLSPRHPRPPIRPARSFQSTPDPR